MFLGVGFRVGGNTGINYLVLQLHYVHPFGGELIWLEILKNRGKQRRLFVMRNLPSLSHPLFLLHTHIHTHTNVQRKKEFGLPLNKVNINLDEHTMKSIRL